MNGCRSFSIGNYQGQSSSSLRSLVASVFNQRIRYLKCYTTNYNKRRFANLRIEWRICTNSFNGSDSKNWKMNGKKKKNVRIKIEKISIEKKRENFCLIFSFFHSLLCNYSDLNETYKKKLIMTGKKNKMKMENKYNQSWNPS